ncbi:MAG: hypothetical protein R3C59_09750 [Planctomycetaceae bacterium]
MDVIVGAPIFSLARGMMTLGLGILSRRTSAPLQRINRACAWCGMRGHE